VLLTTQYLEEADTLADNIVVIDHGTVIAEGTAAALKARLGTTTIELGFRDEAAATTAAGLLASVGAIDRDGKLVHLSVPGDDGAGSMLQTVRTLDDARLDPASLVLREPTLDDVFLSLTGHAAEDGDGDADDEGAVKARRGRRQRRARGAR
jgi:ABC-2 type transport system ATP-binding protein